MTAATPEYLRELADSADADQSLGSTTGYVGFALRGREVTDALRAAADRLESGTRLIRDFTDPDDCWFDHHGGCQAHGYLSLQPGELCPHAEAKRDWLAADTDATPEPQQETT